MYLPNDHKFFLKVEELDSKSLLSLLAFLRVNANEAIIKEMIDIAKTRPNRSPKYDFPPYAEWSEDYKKRFKEIAGDMMIRLGYNI